MLVHTELDSAEWIVASPLSPRLMYGDGFVCDEGFVAAPGWDATTGLGTIDFAQLRKYVATLP